MGGNRDVMYTELVQLGVPHNMLVQLLFYNCERYGVNEALFTPYSVWIGRKYLLVVV
jgi:hypothetical protein